MKHAHHEHHAQDGQAAGKDCCLTEEAQAEGTECHMPAANTAKPTSAHAMHAHHGHGGADMSLPKLTTAATIHCLTGCAIGEFVGLTIGVTLGLNPWVTMGLATGLGFASGYTLGLWPLVKQGHSWLGAFKILWLGETISIAAMEFAMNFTDYHVGGVQAASIFTPVFWLGYAAALPAGFIVAWPVNYWLLKSSVKQPCH